MKILAFKPGCGVAESEIPTAEELKNMSIEDIFTYMRSHPYCVRTKIFSVDGVGYARLDLSIHFFNSREESKDISNARELRLQAWRYYEPGTLSSMYVDPKKDTLRTVVRLFYKGKPYNWLEEYIINEEFEWYVN